MVTLLSHVFYILIFSYILCYKQHSCINQYLPRLSIWLDCGALINVEAPECGTSVVRGPLGHKYESCTKRFPHKKCLLLVASKSLCSIPIKEAILVWECIRVAPKRALRQNSASPLIRLPSINKFYYYYYCYYYYYYQ